MSRERSEEEKRYDEVVKSVVLLKGEHVQAPPTEELISNNGKRLYSVVTIAASNRYGGTRTVTVCDFDRAREIVETNEGDIWECSYRLALIEGFVAGWLYYHLGEEYWYVWKQQEGEDGRYVPIEKPEAYREYIGFGVG